LSCRRISAEEACQVLGQAIDRDQSLHTLLRRPEVTYAALMSLPGAGPAVADPKVAEQVEIQAKYHGYIDRQQEEIARHRESETIPLPQDLDYRAVRGLSVEVQEKLNLHRPETLGQASRVPGITPAAISLLLVHLRRRTQRTQKKSA
jgi:tRNA uridine 5-carboxymethylaminomethyl modification enzyme